MKELTEIKTMNYQKYEEHCEASNKLGIEVIEMGMHETLDVAVEKENMLNENPDKFGHAKECKIDIIRMIDEVPNDGGNDITEIGYLVLVYESINVTPKFILRPLEKVEFIFSEPPFDIDDPLRF